VKPKFFKSQSRFRRWLEKNHGSKKELVVGFYKKLSSKPSITYPAALDEALCFGWIDGVRKSLDNDSYIIRFTPRKPTSIWSNVNVRHVERLKKEGRMTPPGLAAYARRNPKRTGIYLFEKPPVEFLADYEELFRKNKKAWQFFEQQPPGVKRLSKLYVMSAKQDETRRRRLKKLIESSAKGVRHGILAGKTKKK
jgi:uncharacterized protein YdeI (YjbR/CyaY-like superfamily)